MKKLQLLSGALLIASLSFAQSTVKRTVSTDKTFTKSASSNALNAKSQASLWSDDFSDPSTWVIEHDATACDLDWQIGMGLEATGSYAISTIMSTSYDNGCAMIDSDLYGGAEGGSDVEDSWFTTADPIDLSAHSNVVLKFETWYRSYNSERCFIVTSTNNTDWPDLTPDFDASTNPNVYEAFPGISGESGSEVASNPYEAKVNISPSAGGESQVWVRFHWTGTWGYAWFVDDASIVEQPANELELLSGWAYTYDGTEYGRTPQSQLSDTLGLGGEVFNFGSADQSNVTLSTSILDANQNEVASIDETVALLESDSTYAFDNLVGGLSLTQGLYSVNAEISYDVTDSDESNNTYTRNFEVTDDLYSLDGIGVYESTSLGNIGSSSTANGNIIMAKYHIIEETTVNGFEVLISSTGSDAGAVLYPFLKEEQDFINADGTFNQETDMFAGRIAENQSGVDVVQWNVDNGTVYAPLDDVVTLQPGTYYACVELSAPDNGGIYIIDDETVVQPWNASIYYAADDNTVYSNGEAVAIRLALRDYVSIEETSNKMFTVSPNLTSGVFTVNSPLSANYSINVVNVLGEVVSSRIVTGDLNETFDLSNLNVGLYFIKVSNGTNENVQRVIIK